MKRTNEEAFDIPQGCLDGAQASDLVGLYMWNIIKTELTHELDTFGLYRDDFLALVSGTGPEIDRMKKKIIQIFKMHGLGMSFEGPPGKVVNFLDIELNLTKNSYKPYVKAQDSLLYVHNDSNHPPNIIRNLPGMICNRISNLCKDSDTFDESKNMYIEALKAAGHKNFEDKFVYKKQMAIKKKTRKRDVLWYNPPYNKNVVSKIGGGLFYLLKKHFPAEHHLSKIFNKNTVKVSYCCTRNIGETIKNTNNKKMKDTVNNIKACKCDNCPLQGKCKTECVVYKAEINSDKGIKEYVGMTENSLMERLYSHRSDQKLAHARKKTDLSEYVWALKDEGLEYAIKWSILEKLPKFKIGDKFCALCISEKRHIMYSNPATSINKRNEFVSKCRHQNKFKLASLKVVKDADILKHTVIPNEDENINFEQYPTITRYPRDVH